jgi:uncharacterized membrane protein YoaK (UPF0700 family)
MTTNITQATVDLVTLAGERNEPADLANARHRAGLTLPCVVGFVVGCAAGAAMEVYCGLWALVLPIGLAVVAIPLGELWADGSGESRHGDTANTSAQSKVGRQD